MLRTTVIAASLGILIGGCATQGSEDDAETTVPTTAPVETQSEGTTAPSPASDEQANTVEDALVKRYPIDSGLQPLMDLAIEHLAAATGEDPKDITVLNAYLVTWPDSSLGCPAPDMAYVPGVFDGSVIELEIEGTVYRYHTGGEIYEPFLCEEPSGDESVVGQSSSGGSGVGNDPLADTPLELDKPIEKYPDETVPPPGFDD